MTAKYRLLLPAALLSLALAGLCCALAPLEATVLNAKSSIVAEARNDGVDLARQFGADFLLFLDSDMVFPSNTLHRLLAHGRDIVGATGWVTADGVNGPGYSFEEAEAIVMAARVRAGWVEAPPATDEVADEAKGDGE